MTPHPPPEVRPSGTIGRPIRQPTRRPTNWSALVSPPVPLLRLRGHGRDSVLPERCLLGPACLVCRWRRAGLLDGSDADVSSVDESTDSLLYSGVADRDGQVTIGEDGAEFRNDNVWDGTVNQNSQIGLYVNRQLEDL